MDDPLLPLNAPPRQKCEVFFPVTYRNEIENGIYKNSRKSMFCYFIFAIGFLVLEVILTINFLKCFKYFPFSGPQYLIYAVWDTLINIEFVCSLIWLATL